jgi:hypothetical protein
MSARRERLEPVGSSRFAGEVGRRMAAVTGQWLIPAPSANPGMLGMFADRDLQSYASRVQWAGEFAGKHLTAATQMLRVTGDADLRRNLAEFVAALIALQADDGYLGCWPREFRLANLAPNSPNGRTWDTWSHYHAMLGLLSWHGLVGDEAALAAARRIADLFCARFLDAGRRLVDAGDSADSEMNLAPIHGLCLLFRRTGEQRYLALARRILGEFSATDDAGRPLAGDYLLGPLSGVAFWQGPKPRWESLHPIMGLCELYWIDGDVRCRTAFENLWWSMLEGDRHNNGGFTSGEKATGDPYHVGPIETCCTVAWMAMTVEMLKLTGNPLAADELELSLLNSGLGLISPSGRWVTYDTPMDGVREASAQSIVFQARAGTPELNCCSVNGPRVLGLLADWALMGADDGVTLNYYGPCRMSVRLPSGLDLTLVQETEYPRLAEIAVLVEVSHPVEVTLRLRIPAWSHQTTVTINGEPVDGIAPGIYLSLRRTWQAGDRIVLGLDFRLQSWVKPADVRSASLYRGPILLAYDRHLNPAQGPDIPRIRASSIGQRPGGGRPGQGPWMTIDARDADGGAVTLCDFASAGMTGSRYVSWLPTVEPGPVEAFARRHPRRSALIG